jgi:beta-lactamase regulating signal transducer with metallopeptidase domain
MYTFWEIIASNAVVATILAGVAILLGRIWKNAAAVHVLWVVVLLKLFTPPLLITGLPFAIVVLPSEPTAVSHEKTLKSPADKETGQTAPAAVTNSRGAVDSGNHERMLSNRLADTAGPKPWSLSTMVAAIWICGACCTAGVYAVRIRRFATVMRDLEAAPAAVHMMATQLSSRLGLRRVPDVLMSSRALPPLVWSIGLCPRVIVPSQLFARLTTEAQATILAHELVHIRRGDHLVRLLELAATTVFWWHPVVWYASRQLRELEEQCCDGRVVELAPHQARTYAAALVDTLEFLCERPRILIPLRTAIYSTGSLSRRIRMLTQSRTNRLSALTATVVAGLVILPLVVAFAADPEQTSKTSPEGPQTGGAQTAILRGRVTNEAGAPLANVRVRVAIPATDMRFVDAGTDRKLVEGPLDHKLHKLLEARADAAGDYRLEIPGIAARTLVSIDAIKPGYRRLAGLVMSRVDPRTVEVAPGKTAEASLVLKPALYFAGIVVDEHAKPIPGVKIWANEAHGTAGAGVESTASRSDGSFELFNYPVTPRVIQNEKTRGFVGFGHRDYDFQKIEDIYALAPDQRETLRIVLERGRIVTGTVIDVTGRPVPNALIKVNRDGYMTDKATITDANGKFALRGLGKDLTMLYSRALNIKQTVQMRIADNGDLNDLQVRLKPIPFPADLKKHAVLGMQLADVTPELKSAYDLYFDDGAVILDPGEDSDRLRIGRLAEGYCFWMVGHKRVGSVRKFVNQILTEAIGENAAKNAVHGVPVIYRFCTVDEEFSGDGNMTKYLKFTKEDLRLLQIVSDQLADESP